MSITFTPEDVVTAYQRHPEVQPIYGDFFYRGDDGKDCCCPLTMMAVETCDTVTLEGLSDSESGSEAAKQCFDVTGPELNAFWLGYDGSGVPIPSNRLNNAELLRLHALGRACRRAVEEAGLEVCSVDDMIEDDLDDVSSPTQL